MKAIQTKKKIYLFLLLTGLLLIFKDPMQAFIHRKYTNYSQKNLHSAFNPGNTNPNELGIIWQDNFESGDLSEWPSYAGEQTSFDSGECIRPKNGVSSEHAKSGEYALKMTIDSTSKKYNPFQQKDSGCRQFRFKELDSYNEVYLSAWYLLPEDYKITKPGWGMLGQIKSKQNEGSGQSDPIWAWKLESGEDEKLYLHLNWKAAMEGPFENSEYIYHKSNDGEFNHHEFHQTEVAIPINEWFNIQIYVKQSDTYDGQIIIWQNNKEIFNLDKIKTKYPNSNSNWSVTSYGRNIVPNMFTVFVDDVSISTKKISL